MTGTPLLTLIIFLPAAGALLVALLPGRERLLQGTALSVALVDLLLFGFLFAGFVVEGPGFQFVERSPWILDAGIEYHLGVDGLSLFLVGLTSLLTVVVFTVVRAEGEARGRLREYLASFLLLETGVIGSFLALNLVLFYIFWEGMLLPMYVIIGIWGGERRLYATWKFLLYTMAGSALMLVAILAASGTGGERSFDLLALEQRTFPVGVQMALFAAFALAFAIKVPLVPFHTWLPDAHVEAPAGGSVMLAGVLLKMGTYGFFRFAIPLFPAAVAKLGPWVAGAALVGIVYGALLAWAQGDLKKLVAYSSVSHLGVVILGLFSLTVAGGVGGVLQMVNHGLSTGALFLLVGMIYERRHTRALGDFGGLFRSAPRWSVALLFASLASVGLPGLNGFVGEFLVLFGAAQAHRLWALAVAAGMILGAVYLLGMCRGVLFGPLEKKENEAIRDLEPREMAALAPLFALMVIIGLWPGPFTARMEPAVRRTLALATRSLPNDSLALLVPSPVGSGPLGLDPMPRPATAPPAAQPQR